MEQQRKAAEKALSLVGQGYIYGAKGQICSPAFREQQAAQYPDQASSILGTGERWDGMPVWDCAQLTRAAAKEAGVTLVSGATSQWNKTAWTRKGAIDLLPEGETVFLYRQAEGKMQHTGVAIGDGTFVHARGTAYGVVRQKMNEYAWTHWASPWPAERETIARAIVHAQTGSTVNVRTEPGGSVVARLPIGAVVEVVARSAGWSTIRHEGGYAYMQSAYLKETEQPDLDALIRRVEGIEARLKQAGL